MLPLPRPPIGPLSEIGKRAPEGVLTNLGTHMTAGYNLKDSYTTASALVYKAYLYKVLLHLYLDLCLECVRKVFLALPDRLLVDLKRRLVCVRL